MITDIDHKNGQFFINGEPVKTSVVFSMMVKLIEENAKQAKMIQRLIRESDNGEEL